MKKTLITIVAAMAVGTAFVGCSNHDATTAGEVVNMKYEAAFKQTFGEPAPNQDWGFASRTLGTRGADERSNMWGTGELANYPKPADITSEELAAVLAVFNQEGEEHYTALVDFHNFFVQQVYSTELGRSHMNKLQCVEPVKVPDNPEVNPYWPYTLDWNNLQACHVSNFNTGAYSGNKDQGCMLMLDCSTSDWSYSQSQGGGQDIHFFRMEKIGDYYYVGLDYASFRQASENENEQYDRDCVYNDWIVKIVPGNGESSHIVNKAKQYECRVICEDLTAATGTDFDFNDVVFNLKYTEGVNKTFVTVYAAGGTLPLYLQGKEVHQLFKEANPDKNITVKTMINTGIGDELAPVSFTLDGQISPAAIEIRVEKDGELIPLKSEVGQPTAKIAVDPDFEWCAEREDIQKKYPSFSSYVKNGNINWY